MVTAEILAIYQTRDAIFEYAGGPGELFFSDFSSPPRRLPLGIPIKIAIIEKIESARGTMGRGKRPLFSHPPFHRARFALRALFLPSLLTTQ